MKISDRGLNLIKSHEALRLNAYPDPGHGWAVPTIGYGHTSAAGPPKVMKGMTITEAEADAILRQDVSGAERDVRALVNVPLNQNQFDALVSFLFNLGRTKAEKSTLIRKLNNGDYTGAADEFLKWVYSGGKVMGGLERRRKDERALFLAPVNGAPQPQTPTKGTTTGQGVSVLVVLALAAVVVLVVKLLGG